MPPSRSVRHPRCPRCYPRPRRGPRGVARRGVWRSSCPRRRPSCLIWSGPRRRLTSRSHRPSCSSHRPSCSGVALLPLWPRGRRRRRCGRRSRRVRQRLSARPAGAIGGRSVVGPDEGINQTPSEGNQTQSDANGGHRWPSPIIRQMQVDAKANVAPLAGETGRQVGRQVRKRRVAYRGHEPSVMGGSRRDGQHRSR